MQSCYTSLNGFAVYSILIALMNKAHPFPQYFHLSAIYKTTEFKYYI